MANEKFYVDALGTDARDPSKMLRIYYDGTVHTADKDELVDTGWDRIESLPGWAAWDTSQAVSYIEDNVTDLASAKQVLVAMAKMLIALRDFNMPHLDKDRKGGE